MSSSESHTPQPPGRPGLRDVAFYLPDGTLENEFLIASFGFEGPFLENKLGVTRRRVAAAEQATSDLCVAAVRRLLDQTALDPADVDGLIVVTQTPDYVFPQTSAIVQNACGIPTTVAAIDLQLGCSGYVYALSVAEGLMRVHGLSRVLVVTGEKYSSLMRPCNRDTMPLFGDAATASLLVDEAPLYSFGKFTFGTDGSISESIISRGTGSAGGTRDGGFEMDGRAVFSYMMTNMPGTLRRCLEVNGLSVDDVSTWVLHQASRHMVTKLARRMEIPPDRVVLDLEDGGNTGPCSIPLALCRRVLNRTELPEVIGISGFGVGASWAHGFLFKNRRED